MSPSSHSFPQRTALLISATIDRILPIISRCVLFCVWFILLNIIYHSIHPCCCMYIPLYHIILHHGNIPHLFICSTVDGNLGSFQFGVFGIVLKAFLTISLGGHMRALLLATERAVHGGGILVYMVLVDSAKQFFKLCHFTLSPVVFERASRSSSRLLVFSVFSILAILVGELILLLKISLANNNEKNTTVKKQKNLT